ncbi:putative AB5 enterotoxin binding subunit YtxB [Yersinia enterocolitica]|uniref:YtxB n=2 Tax=Yersinia enterocolitica TaxID=630 RepID=Q93M75_YEREN|nr:putative AB5 enterotoxin binding subunit YtxB [Yersinia enterocolitica]AAK67255.1 YtxB [Yersinia enterocolitica]AJJ23469.1 putative ytxB [Yersinia enterocolitica]CAL12193.1 putative lipoprotein [Yersinia enterocolitica subsp. enterocolitica 8081]CNG67415.1 putative lipoprotein [Yersinia enterocolitica]CRY01978.1 putative lipoprotein [Yersinia enterocolitica]
MKLIVYGSVFILLISCNAFPVIASGDLKTQCAADNGTLLKNRLIKNYNTTIMWRPGDGSVNAININIDDQWYGTIAEDRSNGNSAKGLASFAQAAYLINLPVNACVKNKYLRGLEGVN